MSEERNGIAISPGFSVGNALLINQAKTIVEKRKIKTNEIIKEVINFNLLLRLPRMKLEK